MPISLLSFCLINLSIGESGVLNSPTITVWALICNLTFSNASFMWVLMNWEHRCSGFRLHLDGFTCYEYKVFFAISSD